MTDRPPERDLSALTGGARAGGLKGGLAGLRAAPRPAVVPDPEPEIAEPAVDVEIPEQVDVEAPERTPSVKVPETPAAPKKPTKKPGRPASGRASKGIGLPVDLVVEMIAAADAARQSYGDWLMGAFNNVYDVLEQEYPPLPKYRPEVPAPRRTPRRVVQGGRRSVNFRLTPEQLAAIDKRQAELAVESRSEFVTAIVELELHGRS